MGVKLMQLRERIRELETELAGVKRLRTLAEDANEQGSLALKAQMARAEKAEARVAELEREAASWRRTAEVLEARVREEG